MEVQEQLMNDRLKELEDVREDRDMLKAEMERMIREGNDGGSQMKDDFENSLESRKKKITTLKEDNLGLTESCAKLRADNIAKRTEIITLQRKLKEQEKSSGRQDEELASEIFGYMNQLKERLV